MMNFEANPQSLLTFRVGPVLCCAPSFPVRSIITPPKMTHPPGSNTSQPGIFKHGSHIVKVLDLRQKFGIEQSEHVKPGNLIITLLEKDSFAFWVDQILDVFDFPTEGWGNLPAAIPRGIFNRTLLLNNKIHLYSEFEKLATIHDLGYLKHYIQQLTQQEQSKKTDGHTKNNLSEKNSLETNKITSEVFKKVTEQNVLSTETPITNKVTSEIECVKKDVVLKPLISPEKENIKKVDSITSESEKIKPHISSVIKKPVTRPSLNINENSTIPLEKTSTINTRPFHLKTSSPEKRQPSSFINENHAKKSNAVKSQDKTKELTDYSQTTIENNEENSFLPTALFLLFLFIPIAAGLYFLFPKADKTQFGNNNITANFNSTNIKNTTYEDIPQIEKEYETDKTMDTQKVENKYFEIQQAEDENISLEDDLSNQNIESSQNLPPNKNIGNETPPPLTKEDYRAEIIQDNNEITITLHQPITENVSQENETVQAKPTKEEKKAALADNNVSPPLSDLVASVPPKVTIETQPIKERTPSKLVIKEVVHIVVKGDTLWAIAKKYVNDPFLYPELARLSNIKNPHRIYPGNRVRIRFIKY